MQGGRRTNVSQRLGVIVALASLVMAQPVGPVSGAERAAAFRQLPREESYGPWRPLGPVSYGGKVYDLAVDAQDERVIYAAYGAGGETGSANGAGLWVTRDGGDTWTRAVDWLQNSAFLSVRAHPKAVGVVAAGLRAVDYNTARGVMLSRDRGVTWKNIGFPAPEQHVWDIAFDPRDVSTLYVATQTGLWRTPDSGGSWQRLLSYSPRGEFFDDAPSLAISPSGAVLLLAVRGAGVQRSADGGQTWTRVDGLWDQTVPISVVAWAPGDERVVYGERVSGRVDKRGTAVDLLCYRSTDGGVTWQAGAVIPGRHQKRFDMALAVDPRDASRVLAGNVEIHLSADGLRSVTSPAARPHEDHLRIVFAPSKPEVIYSGNDGGVWKSTDQGQNWARIDTGVLTTHAWGLSAASGGRLYVSPGDYTAITFHPSSGWRDAGCGGEFERPYTAPDGMVYLLRRVYPGGRLYRMATASEPCVELGPNTKEKLASSMPVAFGSSDSGKIFVGLERVWRSVDRGRTWRSIGPGASRARLSALAVSPTDDRSLAALGEDGQLWLTTDEGANWRRGAQTAEARAVIFAPPEGKILWVGGAKGLYRSSDGGLTIKRWAGFPEGLAIQRLLADPAQPQRLLAATDYGVTASSDGGETWRRLDWGRPPGWVTEIALADGVLYSTSSQGIWALPLGERKGCDWRPVVAPLHAIPLGSRGGEASLDVYAGEGCPWTVEGAADWVRLQRTPHGVKLRVEPNREQAERTTKLTVAGQTIDVRQSAGPDPVNAGALVQITQGQDCLVPGKAGRPHPAFQFGRCPSEPVFVLGRGRDLFYSMRLRVESRLCADATAEVDAGRPLVVYSCHGLGHQLFQFLPAPNGQHRIRAVTSGLCLARRGDGMVSSPCSEEATQLFRLK